MTAQATHTECPKCKTKMRKAVITSMQSGLAGGNGRAAYNEGMSCPNCHKWIEPEFIPAMQFNPKPAKKPVQSAYGAAQEEVLEYRKNKIMELLDTIVLMRKRRTPWLTIHKEVAADMPLEHMRRYVREFAGDAL